MYITSSRLQRQGGDVVFVEATSRKTQWARRHTNGVCVCVCEEGGGFSREHCQHHGPPGLLEDVNGLGVGHALQAVSVYGDDLVPALQPAVLHGRSLQDVKGGSGD